MRPRLAQPYVVTRGADSAITLDIYDASQAQQTATAGTVTILLGSKVLVDAVAVTSVGPPASYTVPAATTSGQALSDAVLVRWSLTIAGTAYPFESAGYLVRQAFSMTLTDADLLAVDRNLAAYRNSTDSNFAWAIEDARKRIERRLLRRGRRPWLVFDEWALFDAFRFETLAIIYGSGRTGIGSGKAGQLAEEFDRRAEAEFAAVHFRYDESETGTIDETASEGSGAGRGRSAGPGGWRRWRR